MAARVPRNASFQRNIQGSKNVGKSKGKKKGKKSQFRRAAPSSMGRFTRNTMSKSMMDAAAGRVCSILDPFCPAAKGALFPDDSTGARVGIQLRGTGSVNVDANGTQFFVYTPTLEYGFTNVGSVANNFTIPASWNAYAGATTLAGYGSQYRILSMGVTVRSTAVATATSGYIVLTEANDLAAAEVVPVGTLQGSRVYTSALFPGFEASWVSTPQGPQARNWQTFNTSGTFSSVPLKGWTQLAVQFIGCPASSNVAQIEYVINTELIVDMDNVVAQFAPKPPVANAAVIKAASMARAKLESFVEGSSKKVENRIRALVHGALSDAKSAASDFAVASLEGLV
jgi:hypothetical protein